MEKITVTGSSIINHNARNKLGVSVNDYVLLQFFAEHYSDGIVYSEHSCMAMLGIKREIIEEGRKGLVERKSLMWDVKKALWRPIDEWYVVHKEKGYEFGLYWQPVIIESEIITWRNSSKEATKKKMIQCLKECPIEQLIYSKLRYFIMKLESNSLDYVMGAEPFIGPDKHFRTHWTLKPDGEDLLLSTCRKYYWEGMQLDLSGMFKNVEKELTEGPVKIDYND